MSISDWSSDVCSSDLLNIRIVATGGTHNIVTKHYTGMRKHSTIEHTPDDLCMGRFDSEAANRPAICIDDIKIGTKNTDRRISIQPFNLASQALGERDVVRILARNKPSLRSEEHTSALQSLMRISYAVFC